MSCTGGSSLKTGFLVTELNLNINLNLIPGERVCIGMTHLKLACKNSFVDHATLPL